MREVTTPEQAIELVRAFVNTLDREDGVDVLDRAWLEERGLLARGEEADAEEVRRLVRVREAVRELLAAHAGARVDLVQAASELDRAAAHVGLRIRFRPDGTTAVEPGAESDQALGSVLAAIAEATASPEWTRLKACRREDCRWAFVDESRNRTRVWCSMAACGTRAKARVTERDGCGRRGARPSARTSRG